MLLQLFGVVLSERVCDVLMLLLLLLVVVDAAACVCVDDEVFCVLFAVFVVLLVAIVRVPEDICDEDGEPADGALNADCARNAARKFARNGRFVDIISSGSCVSLFLVLSLIPR